MEWYGVNRKGKISVSSLSITLGGGGRERKQRERERERERETYGRERPYNTQYSSTGSVFKS